MAELPVPEHFDPGRAGEVWHVPYAERALEAQAWAEQHQLRPALEDAFRICLVAVDVQNTFCVPGYELYVQGAERDNARLCEFLYRNLGTITAIIPTLDSHRATQIFHPVWLIDEEGRHPDPYTLITAEDARTGRWRINPPAVESTGIDPEYAQQQLVDYTRKLEESGKYTLTIWPYHAMLGGVGHALVSSVEEAIFFHTIARSSQPAFQVKGDNPLTEHYSMFGPEIMDGPDGSDRREERPADRAAPHLRRDRRRRPGEEPLRRLDDRRPARGRRRARARPRPAHVPPRGLHLAGRRAGLRLHGAGERRVRALRRGRDARRAVDGADRELARDQRAGPLRAQATRSSRGFGRYRRPTFALGRPSVRTTSAVKSFSPRISAEPTP